MGLNVRHIIAVLVGLVALSSCKSTSLSTNNKRELKELVFEYDTLNTNLNETVNWNKLFTSDTKVIVEEIEYDTSTETSEPKVKKKRTTTYTNNQKEDSNKDTNTSQMGNRSTTKLSDVDDKETVATKESVNKKNPLKYLSSILWALFSIVILIIGYKLLRKFKLL